MCNKNKHDSYLFFFVDADTIHQRTTYCASFNSRQRDSYERNIMRRFSESITIPWRSSWRKLI